MQDVEPSLRRASVRALVAFSVVMLIGGTALWFLVERSDPGPIATVSTRTVEPETVRAPDRPERYPDELPTLDNVTLLRIRPEPGAVLVELASPTTPSDAIAMVIDALSDDGWDTELVSSTSRVMAVAVKGEQRMAVEVTGDSRKGTPNGWISINLLLEQNLEEAPPPPAPVVPPDAIS